MLELSGARPDATGTIQNMLSSELGGNTSATIIDES